MAKQPRNQPVISRQSDADQSDNHWLRQFEEKLQKNSVQPRGNDLIEQINSIMNTKSKYPSVQAAVDDMMNRSGLNNYLDNVKISEHVEQTSPKKTAQQAVDQSPAKDDKTPDVIKRKKDILTTLKNLIEDSKGNSPISAIIDKLHSLHARDIAEESAWDDEKLIRLVSHLNLKAKKDNPGNFDNYNMLGKGDHSTAESDIDPSNSDMFHALMPSKI
jgi:hypothetical protein